MIVVMAITLYTTRVVLKVLGAEDYGIYNVVCGFVSMFHVLNTCLNTGTNRYYNFALGKGDTTEFVKVYNASLLIQIIIAVIAIILVEVVGLWYVNCKMVIPENRLVVANWIFQYAVLSLLFLILSTPYSAAILAYEKMDYYALVSVVDVILKLGFVIILQYVTIDKLLFYGTFMALVSLANFLMYYLYSRTRFEGICLKFPVDKKIFRELVSFSGWSVLDPITMTVKGQGCNMVLNLFFGTIVNAAYGIANQISVAIDSFTQNISVAFRPQIIQSYACSDLLRTKKLMFSMSKINYMLQTMLIIPLIFELNYLLTLWLGAGYPSYVIPFTICILIISALNCLHAPISMVMVATGKIKKIKTGSLIILGLVIPLGILLFRLGFSPSSIFFVLIALTIVNIIFSVIIMTRTVESIGIKEYLFSVVTPCSVYTVLVTIVPFVLFLSLQSSLLRFFLMCSLTIFLSLPIGYCVLKDYEKKIVMDFCTSVIKRIKSYECSKKTINE